jgi:hypothetical protein
MRCPEELQRRLAAENDGPGGVVNLFRAVRRDGARRLPMATQSGPGSHWHSSVLLPSGQCAQRALFERSWGVNAAQFLDTHL